jgi:hypothetical protein
VGHTDMMVPSCGDVSSENGRTPTTRRYPSAGSRRTHDCPVTRDMRGLLGNRALASVGPALAART